MASCSTWEEPVTLSALVAGQSIGHGSYSQVYVVQSQINSVNYALKVSNMETMTDAHYNLLMEEVKQLRQLNHPGIIRPIIVTTWNENLCVLFPLMTYKSCNQIIQDQFPSGFPENAIGLIVKDVLNALEYIHNMRLIHCAIKASHVLINSNGLAVLSGFRFMTKIPDGQDKVFAADRLEHMTMNLNWLSPEVLAQDKSGFNCQSDIYSIGIFVLELGNGVVPYAQVSQTGLLVKKLQECAPRLWDQRFLPSQEHGGASSQAEDAGPSHRGGQAEQDRNEEWDKFYLKKKYSQEIISLVDLCLIKNPAERPTCTTLMKKKFIKLYQNAPSAELIKVLQLTHPIQMELQTGNAAHPWMSQSHRMQSASDNSSWNMSPTRM